MFIPAKDYRKLAGQLPVLCIDVLIVRANPPAPAGKYLLLKRTQPPLKGVYWPPGGRVWRGEKLIDAARRKVKEETGLKISNLKFIGYYEDQYPDNLFKLNYLHTVSAVFTAKLASTKIKLDGQSSAYQWSKNLPARLRIVFGRKFAPDP